MNGCIGWKHNLIWTDVLCSRYDPLVLLSLVWCSPQMPPCWINWAYAENDPVILDYFCCTIFVFSNERRLGLFSKGYSGSFYCWYQGWMCLLSVGVRVKLMISNQQKSIRDIHSSGAAIQGDIMFIGKKNQGYFREEIWAATVGSNTGYLNYCLGSHLLVWFSDPAIVVGSILVTLVIW